jgi:hypothetical protein
MLSLILYDFIVVRNRSNLSYHECGPKKFLGALEENKLYFQKIIINKMIPNGTRHKVKIEKILCQSIIKNKIT